MRLNSIEMQHLLSFQCGCCCFINVMSLFKRFQVSFSKVLELITRFQANVLYLTIFDPQRIQCFRFCIF